MSSTLLHNLTRHEKVSPKQQAPYGAPLGSASNNFCRFKENIYINIFITIQYKQLMLSPFTLLILWIVVPTSSMRRS